MANKTAKYILAFLLLLFVTVLPSTAGQAAETAQSTTSYYTIGNSWDYTLTHEVLVENLARSYAFDSTITIPLIDETSPLYNQLVGMELSPYPDRIVTEADGSRYAVYEIGNLEGYDSVTFVQRYALRVFSVDYTFDTTAVANTYSDLELRLLTDELSATSDVQCDDAAILEFATQAADGETNPYQIAHALFAAVSLATDYDEADVAQDALSVLERGSATCEGYTNLYLACLRAMGIPCRQVTGYLYQPALHSTAPYLDLENRRLLANGLRHSWVEFYLPSLGWVAADPTFIYTFSFNGQVQKFVNWSFFASIPQDRRYIASHVGDLSDESIDIRHTGGNLDVTFTASLVPGHVYTPFADISGHWAQQAVTFCVEQGLFQGVSAASFAPEEPMTRAMFVTVLGRLYEAYGGKISSYNTSVLQFTDIGYHSYYIDYLGWAVDHQLIEGYGDGLFGPDDSVTREQMGKMIFDFLALMEQQLPAEGELDFADSAAISDWAVEGILACTQNGVISGYPDQTFRPDQEATRAQVAAIIERISRLLNGETLIEEETAPAEQESAQPDTTAEAGAAEQESAQPDTAEAGAAEQESAQPDTTEADAAQ